MTSASSMRARALLEAYDFAGLGSVVDVGGGRGGLLAALLKAYPIVLGVLFDLPRVVEGADPALLSPGLADRCQIVGGTANYWGPILGVVGVTALVELLRSVVPLVVPGTRGPVELVGLSVVLGLALILLPSGLTGNLAVHGRSRPVALPTARAAPASAGEG